MHQDTLSLHLHHPYTRQPFDAPIDYIIILHSFKQQAIYMLYSDVRYIEAIYKLQSEVQCTHIHASLKYLIGGHSF